MDNPQESTNTKEKGQCQLCKFVRIFAAIAFVVTLVFLLFARMVSGVL